MKNLLIVASILILTSACSTRTVVVSPGYQTPLRPELPKVADSDLSCIADSTYKNLAKRDQAWRFHVEKLEELLKPIK